MGQGAENVRLKNLRAERDWTRRPLAGPVPHLGRTAYHAFKIDLVGTEWLPLWPMLRMGSGMRPGGASQPS